MTKSLPAVSKTALGVAGLRAMESTRPDRLFEDPYAGAFFEAGRARFADPSDPRPENALGKLFYPKGGLGGKAPEWLTEHGWQTRFDTRSELAVAYGRASMEDLSGGGFVTAVRT